MWFNQKEWEASYDQAISDVATRASDIFGIDMKDPGKKPIEPGDFGLESWKFKIVEPTKEYYAKFEPLGHEFITMTHIAIPFEYKDVVSGVELNLNGTALPFWPVHAEWEVEDNKIIWKPEVPVNVSPASENAILICFNKKFNGEVIVEINGTLMAPTKCEDKKCISKKKLKLLVEDEYRWDKMRAKQENRDYEEPPLYKKHKEIREAIGKATKQIWGLNYAICSNGYYPNGSQTGRRSLCPQDFGFDSWNFETKEPMKKLNIKSIPTHYEAYPFITGLAIPIENKDLIKKIKLKIKDYKIEKIPSIKKWEEHSGYMIYNYNEPPVIGPEERVDIEVSFKEEFSGMFELQLLGEVIGKRSYIIRTPERILKEVRGEE